jgi:ABC-2 type transport system permease protein
MIPMAFVFMALIAFLFTTLGTAIASILEDMQAFPLIMNFLVMPLFFLSGALFPLNDLPGPIAILTRFNPLTYGVDGLRGALVGVMQFSYVMDISVLTLVSLVLLAIGSWLFSRIQI